MEDDSDIEMSRGPTPIEIDSNMSTTETITAAIHGDRDVVMVRDSDDELDGMWWRRTARSGRQCEQWMCRQAEANMQVEHLQGVHERLRRHSSTELGMQWVQNLRNGQGSLVWQVLASEYMAQIWLVWGVLGKSRTSANHVKKMTASLSAKSNHPLSRAIASMEWAEGGADIDWNDWTEHSGLGVQASRSSDDESAQDDLVRLGSLNWLRGQGVALGASDAFQKRWMEQGATVVGFSVNQNLMALLALKDLIKPKAFKVLERLRSKGWAIHMVTGDHKRTASAIASELGIEDSHIHAEVKPEQKATIIRDLQDRGERVAFIGDGINDAPALEQADLGIAVSRASDIAREASDMVLLKAGIDAIPEALNLSKSTLRTIKQNLFWAFFYNAAAIPLAMFGFMSPLLCAAAMGFSDVLVIGNSLRLRWLKK